MNATGRTTCPSCGAANRVPVAAKGRPRCGKCSADLPWLVEADDASFGGAVDTGVLVLVDLWAAWCGPCRTIAPILERLAVTYAGRLKVVKVDVDRAQKTAARFRASSIPMLLLMRDGKVVDTIVGAQPERVFVKAIDAQLAT
jgi:thioredoxin 2